MFVVNNRDPRLVPQSGAIFSLMLLVLSAVAINPQESDFLAREKRSDIDLQTCIDNFDIHRDKIIRTQDSQTMGAKYLTEIDLGSREECLRLCCETENCDVFVFEEKNSGSCYLFHCGPPEDFKCKFTHHVNYSSAVLAINRHLPDLESQIKLTKHEQDLNKLRKPEVEADAVAAPLVESRTTPSSTSTTTLAAKTREVVPTEVAKAKPAEEGRKCSRYQFECRSTSECIAIYNACDGIPQCADGSDEAPELGCPESLTTAPPAHLPAPPPKYNSNIAAPRLHPLPPVLPQSEMYRPQLPQDSLGPSQLQAASPYQEADFLRPVPNSRTLLSPKGQFEGPQVAQYRPGSLPMQSASNWVPHQSNQMPQQLPPYSDKNSHIFNHKETGLQVPDGQEIRYNKHKGAMQYLHRALGYSNAGQVQYGDTRDYLKVPNYYDTYRQPVQQENWSVNPPDEQYGRYPQEPSSGKDWHQDIMQPGIQKNSGQNYKAPSPDRPVAWKTDVTETPKHEQDKMAHELKHSKENMVHDSDEPKIKVKIEKHKHSHPHEQYPDVVAYKIDGTSELQDGAAETPGGAVLSLTLGLIITCIMALLIGCRLRVWKRMRKAGKSYAHDADYLVNGMYL